MQQLHGTRQQSSIDYSTPYSTCFQSLRRGSNKSLRPGYRNHKIQHIVDWSQREFVRLIIAAFEIVPCDCEAEKKSVSRLLCRVEIVSGTRDESNQALCISWCGYE